MCNYHQWLNGGSFFNALFAAFVTAFFAFVGGVIYYKYERCQLGEKIAYQLKWEILENITNTYDHIKSNKQEETFLEFNNLDPESSILEANSYYLSRFSVRNEFFKSRVGDLNLLAGGVLMKDVLNFYSMLYTVDESEKQLHNVFANKVPLKVKTVIGISKDICENTKKMRTIGAQAVGKIMYYYDNYDFAIKKIDEPELVPKEILAELDQKTLIYLDKIKSGQTISAYDLASSTQLLNPSIYDCGFSFDVCALATAHYLLLKTGMVDDSLLFYNGYVKR